MRTHLPPAARRLLLAAAAALPPIAAALAPAAPAQAGSSPTIHSAYSCYISGDARQPVTIVGTGFTPGDTVAISASGFYTTTVADRQGDVAARATPPSLHTDLPAVHTITVTASDQTTGAHVRVKVHVATLSVSATPNTVRDFRRDRVTYRFSGFAPGKTIYEYFTQKGTVRASLTFAKANGPCGTLTRKALLYPGGRPRSGRYTVTFEQSRRYSKTARPQVVSAIDFPS